MIRRCRAGQIVRAAAGSYRRRAGVLITIGLVYLPVSILVGASASVLQMVPLVRRITALAGNASETSVLFARLAGGAARHRAQRGADAVLVEAVATDTARLEQLATLHGVTALGVGQRSARADQQRERPSG